MGNGIFYTDTGSGRPVIFIHGYCETHHIWDEYSRKLSKSHRIITIDLPGFGKTPLPTHPFTLEDIAASIHEQLTILGVGQHVMIGHSLGGYIALAYVKKFPDEIRGFGLFHSSALADTPEKKETRTKLIDFISEKGVPPFIQNFIPS
ncbi:MAG TPA: alpha/beta fold hydrolase, partial [Cyclobacteriaceae bacterium]|nr:alpha/beta fold hydrolase [Cyclobacteriaceae bacterium]